PQIMHREECNIEADKKQPEIPVPEFFVHETSGNFREPEIECTEQRKYRAANQHVVQVRNDKICIVHLQIERHGRKHQASESAQQKYHEECKHKQQRRAEVEAARD